MTFNNGTKNLIKVKEPVYLRQLATLFDGDHFGEMALIDLDNKEDIGVLSPPKQRKANCIAVDKCYLLEIPHQTCIRAYQATGAKHMKERLDFLLHLPGFRMIDKNTLLPLASNMRVKRYKIGEYIVRQREIPNGLIIIHKGECIAAFEKERTRDFYNVPYTKLKPKEMNIHFNDYNDERYDTQSGFKSRTIKLKSKIPQVAEGIDESEIETFTKRTFKNDILEKTEDPTGKKSITYKDFINFYKLHSGQLFGYRTLMPLDIYILNKSKTAFEKSFLKRSTNEEREKFYNESCLSIIANSAIVEVFIIEKSLMTFLPEHTGRFAYPHNLYV